MRTIFLVIMLLATPALAIDCAKLAPKACMESLECQLDCHRANGKVERCTSGSREAYFCRAEQTRCEIATTQTNMTRQLCEGRKGCTFRAADCFCGCAFDTPACNCACGGGLPANCVETGGTKTKQR